MLQRARQPDAQHVREELQLLQLLRLAPARLSGGHTNPQPRTVVALMVMKLRLQATHISGLLF